MILSETSFSLKPEFYPIGRLVHSVLDISDREGIEAEYVSILCAPIRTSGCASVLISRFTDYRGCYSPKIKMDLTAGLSMMPIVSGQKINVHDELDGILKMSFRKLISVRLVACGKIVIRTYDDGIGATVAAEDDLVPCIDLTNGHFIFDEM